MWVIAFSILLKKMWLRDLILISSELLKFNIVSLINPTDVANIQMDKIIL
jgi:hypothetical protein